MIGNNRNFRDIDTRGLRSYIRWKMANSPLLTDPVNPEKKLTPNQCCIAKTMRPEYYPYLVQPKVDTERLMDSLKITGADIDKLLIDIGVHESIKTLSTEALYKILGSLPESDPEGKKARSIYHEILNYDERLLDEEDETYRKFKESGKVLCRVGPKTEYVSVKDAYYLVNRHSQDIQSKFKLIDLEYKRGREKVSKLFCVKIVGKIDVRLMDKVDHPLNQELQKFLVEAKDYIYTIMHGSDTKGEILEALMNTEIIMATSVRAEMTHVGKISEINLSPDEYIHITNDNSYYICVDQEIDDFESLRRNVFLFSNSLSLIFASITGRDSDQMHRIIGEDKNNWGCFLQTIFEDEFENELKIAREKIDEYKSEQNNEQHIRFWNIFSSCVVDVSDDVSITNEDELNSYLTKMFPEAAQESWIRESADYTRLSSTIQEKIFKLIRSVPIDFERLSGYYPQLDFREMIRQDLIEIQNRYTPAFKLGLYHKLKDDAPESKDTYFDECERYVELFNTNAEVPKYAYDIEDYFMKKVEEQFGFELGDEEKLDTLDIDEKLRANKVWWEEEYGIELNEEVLQSNMVKSLLLFAEYEAFTEEVSELDDRVAKSVAALRAEAGIEEQSPELDIPKVHHTTSAIEYVQPQGESEEMADRVAATEDQESDDEGKSSTPQQSHGQHRTAIRPAISAAVAERAQYGVKERTTSYDSSQRVSDNTDRTAIARSGEDEKSRVIVVDGMELDFENDHISGINRSLDELAQRLNNSLKDSATPGMITSQSKSGAGSGSSGGSGVSQESRNSVYIGYAAEYLAYKVLKNKYGATSVEWLSENAKRAEVNEDGRAGCGYDIGVKVNGMDRYVEVKAITNPSIGFEITGNELRFAEENADRYDILMVQSITENPQLVYIKSFFDIPDKEKLTNNSRFTLELPSARIRFELKGE